MGDDGLAIGEVARRSGVPASTLRYYESIDLLAAPERVGGQRRYDATVLERLAMIGLAQRAGFTLREVRILLVGFSADTPPSERWRTLARRKLPEIEALIERAEEMRRLLREGLECRCLRLEDCELVARAVEERPAPVA